MVRMRLYLVRHGKAAPGALDDLRPLTPQGRADAGRLAALCAGAGIRVDEIRHSGLVRARETAEILATRLHPPGGLVEMQGLRPDDDAEGAAIELSLATSPLMVVSHMPFVAELAGRLTSGRDAVAPDFETSELRTFVRAGDRWSPGETLRGHV